MDAIFELGRATVAEVREHMPEPPSYSAVRAMVVRLEQKGHLKHAEQGPRYVYSPVVRLARARESATRRLLSTFFEGSTVKAVSAMLDMSGDKLDPKEFDELARLIEEARRAGR